MSKDKDKSKENTIKILTPNDIEWSDHVLSLLSDDEKIDGNPTTDGLRRIFEVALNCRVISSTSEVVQSPDLQNERRATVVHHIAYILNSLDTESPFYNEARSVSGSADVYYGNCDKVYNKHPVAVAETRAEGRALRRALKLRKVVAAEEISTNAEEDTSGEGYGKIGSNQINFIDTMARRLNIDVIKLLTSMSFDKNIKNLTHDDAVSIIRELSKYQQNVDNIVDSLKPYQENWK